MDESNKLYIDIQSLLETRQSCLIHLLGEEETIEYIHTEAYYLRDLDEFPVDKLAYTELSASDSPLVLSNATITYLLVVLTSRLSQMEKMNAFNERKGQTELIVNTHPFKFTEDVVGRFKNALFLKLQIPVRITIVCEPLSVWTPGFIKNAGITQFYCYEGSEWLSQHSDQVVNGALKDVRMFFPTLGRAKLEKDDIKRLQKTGFKDIFAYTEFLFSRHVKIQFLPVAFYNNLVSATAILETFNEGVKSMKINTPDTEGVTNGDIQHEG